MLKLANGDVSQQLKYMWTKEIQSINRAGQNPSVDVLFTDGKYQRLETVPLSGLTANDLRIRIENMRSGFEINYAFIDGLDPKTFDLTPPITDQAELDKISFYDDLIKLSQWKLIMKNDDADLIALQASVEARTKTYIP